LRSAAPRLSTITTQTRIVIRIAET
jgi:hypothetical protein